MPPKMQKKIYTKLDQIPHILMRTEMYCGSTRPRVLEEYIAESNENTFSIFKNEITSSPAILRIFVEPLSNAIDNVERSKNTKTPCTKIKVTINERTGETSIWNDGDVIPVELNEEEKCYNHSLVFGQLLTSSNYDDDEERVLSGRFGYGIKLLNIFSRSFKVRGFDPIAKKLFTQEWRNNMTTTDGPVVKISKLSKGFTEVIWTLDFERFKMKGYTKDIISLYTRYVIDAAMLSKVDVYLNDVLIPVNNLTTYSRMYKSPTNDSLLIRIQSSEILVTPATEFQAVSFVNGVYTRHGGRHVDAWSEAIFRPLVNKFNKKGKPQITIRDVKQFFRLFVVATVINPEFNGQNKEKLESPSVEVSVKTTHINTILKWSICAQIEDIIRMKEIVGLKKAERKKKGYTKIEGLDPANNAGGKFSHQCILILCEGLSAKTYAVAGIEKGAYGKTGRDFWGILPLRGKVLNVRNATPTSIAKNREITDVIQALGVRHDVDYNEDINYRQLRYGKVMILADADCFTNDTPLLIKRGGCVDIVSIEHLYTIGSDNIEVWSSGGWTCILGIKKKESNKVILEIKTRCGLIKCTFDHKLILESGKEIIASDVKIGDHLLQSGRMDKHIINDNIIFEGLKSSLCNLCEFPITDGSIDKAEAFVWGLFFADGFCGIYPQELDIKPELFVWHISSINKNILDKAKMILEMKYPECTWDITQVHQNLFCLSLDCVGRVEKFVKIMRKCFYDPIKTKNKKVPIEILNSPLLIQQSFFDGYCDGNRFHSKKPVQDGEFFITGQIGAKGVCYILEKLGYLISPNPLRDGDIFIVLYRENSRCSCPGEVRAIRTITYKESYVYDIETENHCLNAGVGDIVVHNCDGIHIEGLVMNLFHTLFPTLLERSDPFLISMKTPIVRVFRPRGDILFYDERKFKEFAAKQTKKFEKKYYKGLGTTKPEDVPDTFGAKIVEYVNDQNASFNMNKIFHRKYADARKIWLEEYNPANENSLDDMGEIVQMGISDFIDGEMIKFSLDDCKRSIPSGVDGLKESQRKILYAVKKRNLKYSGKSLKVAQLSGYVAEHTNYHHGEQNLYETITKMAQEFPGSNNIPLLFRDGMFGTRAALKDAASARYIFTKLDMLTQLIYRPEDDVLLEKVIDDGDEVEPKFYVPIIPMILTNGCLVGIGTGWSCNVPCYNPLDLISSIKTWLAYDGNVLSYDEDGIIVSLLPELIPWYRDFEGTIESVGDNKFITYGVYEEGKKGTIIITELPIGLWTDKFKEMLEDHVDAKRIKSIKNYSTPKKVNFIVTEASDGFTLNTQNLKLYSYLYTSNMVMFNDKEQLRKFSSVDEIINCFCQIRLDYYGRRKRHLINGLENELKFMGNKERFIQEVIDETLNIMNVPEEDVVLNLEENGYDKEIKKVTEDGEEIGGYDYLLRMQIRTFTAEKVRKLQNDIASKKKELGSIKATSEKKMWLSDLIELEKEYHKFLKVMKNEKPKATQKKK